MLLNALTTLLTSSVVKGIYQTPAYHNSPCPSQARGQHLHAEHLCPYMTSLLYPKKEASYPDPRDPPNDLTLCRLSHMLAASDFRHPHERKQVGP